MSMFIGYQKRCRVDRATPSHAHAHSARAQRGMSSITCMVVHQVRGHAASYFALSRGYLDAVDNNLSRERHHARGVLARCRGVLVTKSLLESPAHSQNSSRGFF